MDSTDFTLLFTKYSTKRPENDEVALDFIEEVLNELPTVEPGVATRYLGMTDEEFEKKKASHDRRRQKDHATAAGVAIFKVFQTVDATTSRATAILRRIMDETLNEPKLGPITPVSCPNCKSFDVQLKWTGALVYDLTIYTDSNGDYYRGKGYREEDESARNNNRLHCEDCGHSWPALVHEVNNLDRELAG